MPDNESFSNTDSIRISWTNNGDLMTKFKIFVYDNSTGLVEYQSGEVISYSPSHILPPLSLSNGKIYKYQIQIFNSAGDSICSDFKIFRCNSKPIVTIDTDGYVRNQKATIQANYSQAEGIGLKCYKFVLYDSFERIIEESEYIYDTALIYSFDYILIDDNSYNVECIVFTQNDISGTSGRVSFVADYISPNVFFLLSTENDPYKPYLRLNWTTVRIIGETEGSTQFISNEKLDTRTGKVYYDECFNFGGNFTIRLWIENIPNELDIARIIGMNGDVVLKYYDNKVHAFKTMCGYKGHIASDLLGAINTGDTVYICLQQVDGLLNIKSEVLLNE